MKKARIKEYTILYQYLLLLKEPIYVFLIQVFLIIPEQKIHLSGE
uniref:Uncharacterized protein n=1 Tax=uncultured bacterium contig00062 TaxID=1181545 RepID=A0A806K159_9BACT|nr:hypothetical protein [uncultured bacterium contig00062]